MYIYHVHSEKLCDKIYQYKNKVYYFSKTKKLWSILSRKHISVFIDFKHGEFCFYYKFI